MVANIRGYTPNYSFKLINFDTPRWHTLEYDNWTMLDALLTQTGVPNYRGEWIHTTLYNIGDRVQDGEEGHLYRALVQHTSASSGTMAEERALHPEYWTIVIPGVPLYRDAWIPGATYAQGDIVHIGYDYYLCSQPHVSSPLFVTDEANWEMIFSAESIVADATTAADAAEDSATSAAGSASAAAGSATEADTSADNAALSAEAASSAQGAFKWNYDSSTVLADPGTGDMRLDNAYPPAATVMMLNANTMDPGYPDVSDWITTWDDSTNPGIKGTIYVRKVGAPQNFMVFNITGTVTDLTTYLQIGITPIAFNGAFAHDDDVTIAFSRAGDRGVSGPGGGDLFSENNLSDVADAATSVVNLGLGPLSVPTFAQVTISNAPVDDNHATTKAYVDAVTTFEPAGSISSDTMGEAIIELDAEKVAKAGDVMTGDLRLNTPDPKLILNREAGAHQAEFSGHINGVPMWRIIPGNSIPQTGGNSGADFSIQRWSDAGNFIDVPLSIIRSSGHLVLSPIATVPTIPEHVASKNYVDTTTASATDGKVNRSGDTMTGWLNLVDHSYFTPVNATFCGTFYKGSHTSVDRFFLGTEADTFRLYSNITGNVMILDGPTGTLNFPQNATVPTAAATASQKIANTTYVEQRANDWGNYHASLRVAKTGDTMTGRLTTQGGISGNSTNLFYVAGGISQASGGYFELQAAQYNHAFFTFHIAGVYAFNFGGAEDGNLYHGGYSIPGIYQLWSSRHFTNVIQNYRMVHQGDYTHGSGTGMAEPYSCGVATGFVGLAVGNLTVRYRQCQAQFVNGAWYAVGY